MILYYWWFGPSQTEAQVIRELDAMRDAEIGGVFIFPVYPLSASDDVNYPYLSEKFLSVLDSTVGMRKSYRWVWTCFSGLAGLSAAR